MSLVLGSIHFFNNIFPYELGGTMLYEYLQCLHSNGVWTIPVSCGLFGLSGDHFESYQSLDERLIKNKVATFFFEAKGTSMEPLIFENDLLIVDRSIKVTTDQIVVLSLGGRFICKRLIKKHKKIFLESENPKCKTVEVTSEMQMQIFGVVIGICTMLAENDTHYCS